MHRRSFLQSLLIQAALGQQVGNYTPEVHPLLPSERCTVNGGCKPANTSIVLDANFRYLHNVGGYVNCVEQTSQSFNKSICSDPEGCVKNCAVEGAEYSGYGLKTSGDAVTMNLFVLKKEGLNKASPRIYLFDETAGKYANFSLLNQEFTFDVDTSRAGCGVNGALYFAEMDMSGHQDELNKAGAKYGTGYCDAQCPKQNFLQGRVGYSR